MVLLHPTHRKHFLKNVECLAKSLIPKGVQISVPPAACISWDIPDDMEVWPRDSLKNWWFVDRKMSSDD